MAREERIAEIKKQIAAGTYETPEKLEQALEAFLQAHDFLPLEDSADPLHEQDPPKRPK